MSGYLKCWAIFWTAPFGFAVARIMDSQAAFVSVCVAVIAITLTPHRKDHD